MRQTTSTPLLLAAAWAALGCSFDDWSAPPDESVGTIRQALASTVCDPTAPFDPPQPAFTGSTIANGLALSQDGLTAYVSIKASPSEPYAINVMHRPTTANPFAAPMPMAALNSGYEDRGPRLSDDGATLYFSKLSSTAGWTRDVAAATRGTAAEEFSDWQFLSPVINSPSYHDQDPFFVSSRGELYFASEKPSGTRDIYVSSLQDGAYLAPTALSINLPDREDYAPVLSRDGLTVYFASTRPGIGGDTNGDVWMATRAPNAVSFDGSTVTNLAGLNTSYVDVPVALTDDDCTLYFASGEETGDTVKVRLYRATRPPTAYPVVTTTLKVLGSGSVTTAPFQCSSTCSAQGAPESEVVVQASGHARWRGSCTSMGGNSSSDGVVVFTNGGVCTVDFRSAGNGSVGQICFTDNDCTSGLYCVSGLCGQPTSSCGNDSNECAFQVPPVALGRNGHDPISLSDENTPRILTNLGLDSHLELATDWGSDVAATAMAFGDFDGDCKQELAVGRSPHDGGRLLVFDDVEANYAWTADLFKTWGIGFGVTAIATGDIDNDGLDEIAVSRNRADGGAIEVTLVDDALHGYAVLKEFDVGDRGVHALAFGDADNDGRLELLAARDGKSGSSAGRIFLVQDASQNYAQSEFASWGDSDRSATAVAVGDFDDDASNEIAVGRNAGDNARVLIYRHNAQTNNYDTIADFAVWGADRAVTGLTFGDVDGDLDDELVVGRNAGSGPRLFVYDTPISGLAPHLLKELGEGWGDERGVRSLAVGDVDSDGRAEIYAGRTVGSGPRVIVYNDALAEFRELERLGDGWGDDRDARSIAIAEQRLCQSRTAPQVPPDVDDAVDGFEARRLEMIRYWLRGSPGTARPGLDKLPPGGASSLSSEQRSGLARSVFGDWTGGSKDQHGAIHRMLAGAAAIKLGLPAAPGMPGATDLIARGFPELMNVYLLENIIQTETVGTNHDFDFILVQLIELAYYAEPITLPSGAPLISDAALGKLLLEMTVFEHFQTGFPGSSPLELAHQNAAADARFIPWATTELVHLTYDEEAAGLVSIPETENHLMMTNTWSYLINQWVESGRRGPSGLYGAPDLYHNAGSQLETFLLSAVGRFLKNGSWETNARPYQAFTLRALQLLASYAGVTATGNGMETHTDEGNPVRKGARNALDTLATKYAFQSLHSKRTPPIRRHRNRRNDTGVYMNDYLAAIFGVLSGATVYDPSIDCQGLLCPSAINGPQPWYFGLDSALLDYRIPLAIQDFMLNPDNHQPGFGAWARMQDRYSENHYRVNEEPRYPLPNGFAQPDLNAQIANGTLAIEPAQEFYFITRDYMNTSGSRTELYSAWEDYWGSIFASEEKLRDTDFYGKPSALIGNRDLGYWRGAPGEAQQTLVGRGGYVGTYKNVVVSFSTLSFDSTAIRIPDHWGKGPAVQVGDASFFVVDSTTTRSVFEAPINGGAPYFLVVGQLPLDHQALELGLWEVVPRRPPFMDEQTVIDRVQSANAGNLLSAVYGYEYTTAVSDEKLSINRSFPLFENHPFLAIDDSSTAVADHHLNTNPSQMPLMDVRQVNHDYIFTGVSYACASGDGRVVVNNPYLGTRLVLDSRDHLNPTRHEEEPVPPGPDPCDKGFVVDSVVSGGGG